MTTTRSPRGYIMIESVISGALLAVALGTTISLIGSYRREVTMAARRAEASSIAIGTADELMTRPHATGSQPLTPEPSHPGFKTGWTIVQAPDVTSTPPLPSADDLHLLTVTVEYPTTSGPKQLIYQRLKRQF